MKEIIFEFICLWVGHWVRFMYVCDGPFWPINNFLFFESASLCTTIFLEQYDIRVHNHSFINFFFKLKIKIKIFKKFLKNELRKLSYRGKYFCAYICIESKREKET